MKTTLLLAALVIASCVGSQEDSVEDSHEMSLESSLESSSLEASLESSIEMNTDTGCEGLLERNWWVVIAHMVIFIIVMIKIIALINEKKVSIELGKDIMGPCIWTIFVISLIFFVLLEGTDQFLHALELGKVIEESELLGRYFRAMSLYTSFALFTGISICLVYTKPKPVRWIFRIFMALIFIATLVMLILIPNNRTIELMYFFCFVLQLLLWPFLEGKPSWCVWVQVLLYAMVLLAAALMPETNEALPYLTTALLAIKALTLEPLMAALLESVDEVVSKMHGQLAPSDVEMNYTGDS